MEIQVIEVEHDPLITIYKWYGARQCGALSNTGNLILWLFLYMVSQVHPQQHKQTTNINTMVMEPLALPAVWIL
jgi:hypothetical protein